MKCITSRRHGRCSNPLCRSRCSTRCIRRWPNSSSRCRSVRWATGRWAGAIRPCCSDRSPSLRCICAAWRCLPRKVRRSPPTLLAFFNQMLFVQSRIAMLDIFALAFSLFAIAAFMHGFRKVRPHLWFALAGVAFGLSIGCKWSGLFVLAVCIVIVAVIRLMQGWRTQFADARPEDWYRPDLWPDFRAWHFAGVLRVDSGRRLSRDLHSALRIVGSPDFWKHNGGSSATTPRPRSRAIPI